MVYLIMLVIMLLGAANYNNSMAYLLTFLLGSIFMVGMLHTYRNLRGMIIHMHPVRPVFAGDTASFPLLIDNRSGNKRVSIDFTCNPEHRKIKDRMTGSITINIPAGVDSGSRLRLRNEGEAGIKGGPAGDLHIIIYVKEHPIFHRRDNDVICELPITITQAALGAEVIVPTLDGKSSLKIPSGTQPNKVFRMRGKGIIDLHGSGRGDQLVRVIVETPTRLSSKQKDLLQEFARLSGDKTNPLQSGFMKKIKDFFS